MPFCIKERQNPQLGTYYVACGNISVEESEKMKKTLYGTNQIYQFDTEEAYQDRLWKLNSEGARMQSR